MNIAGDMILAVGLISAAVFAPPLPASTHNEAPFWQLHGAAPQARENSIIEGFRATVRQADIVVAKVAASR